MADRLIDSTSRPTCSNRRRLLQIGLGASASLIMPNAFANILKQPERKLSFYNLHTGEKLTATYWAEGQYQNDELQAINHILRDFRTGDVKRIDPKLLELLNLLHHKLDAQQAFNVISGYRSPHTNAALRKHSHGVAKHSLHMEGKAIDIRLPGRPLTQLHTAALKMHLGGVGFYPTSNFVHVDTGRVRHWQGS